MDMSQPQPQSPSGNLQKQLLQQYGTTRPFTQENTSGYTNLFAGQGTGGMGTGSNNVVTNGSGNPSGPNIDQATQNYINQINDVYNGLESNLGPQRTAQENIAKNSFDQSVSDLTAQKDVGMRDLATSKTKATDLQAKTLRDLATNLQNQYMAGNVFLGARGAGDSSAANQYSYALNKIGSQQRGDVQAQTAQTLNDIADREFKLNTTFTQEKSRLNTEYNNAIQGIAQWFADAQNQIRTMKGNAQIQASQNALNMAMQAANDIRQQTLNRQSALESWALSNSRTLNEVKQNLSAVSNFNPSAPQLQQFSGTPQVDSAGNFRIGGGFGQGTSRELDLFGRPIVQ